MGELAPAPFTAGMANRMTFAADELHPNLDHPAPAMIAGAAASIARLKIDADLVG